MSKIVLKTAVINFILMAGFLLSTCSPYFLEYDNPVDPKADSYNGYKTVASAAEVTGDWPEEGAEVTWCVFNASEVAAGATDRYALQIDEITGDFSDSVYENQDSVSNLFYPELTEGNYRYRVQARPTGGEWPESWSDVVSFTAVSGVDAESVLPASGGSIGDTTPLLDWNDIEDAESYQVEFATSEAGLDGSNIRPAPSSGYQIPDTDTFSSGDTCYWHIRGVNEDGVTGVWSGVFSFFVPGTFEDDFEDGDADGWTKLYDPPHTDDNWSMDEGYQSTYGYWHGSTQAHGRLILPYTLNSVSFDYYVSSYIADVYYLPRWDADAGNSIRIEVYPPNSDNPKDRLRVHEDGEQIIDEEYPRISASGWNHLECQYDPGGGTINVYVNGSLHMSAGGIPAMSGQSLLGAYYRAGFDNFEGEMAGE